VSGSDGRGRILAVQPSRVLPDLRGTLIVALVPGGDALGTYSAVVHL